MDESEEANALQSRGNDSDDDEDSEGKLEIVIQTTKKRPLLKPTENEKKIIESIEDDLDRKLDEKASKTKLNVANVKNIIKHVVTNEHVLALVRKAENPADCSDETVSAYEPKLTRAKAKELFSTSQIPPVPWITATCLPSQTQILVKKAESLVAVDENLKDKEKNCDEEEDEKNCDEEEDEKNCDEDEEEKHFDDDEDDEEVEDENMPDEDVSDDDVDSSMMSDNQSVPPTPSAPVQTIWSEDGVFKVPQMNEENALNTKPNIVRTENMEQSSELTEEKNQTDQETDVEEPAAAADRSETDLEDNMDYDNEEWMDFLKTFALPLDEIAKATEDDEQDPEYNILADEEIDKIDKEELRVDKAVKISRKELNNLIAELFESFNWGEERIDTCNQPEIVMITITEQQLMILEQQMRQHVQLLTQNFILTYQHPEFHVYSTEIKEFLLNLKLLCDSKHRSAFFTLNLDNAIRLVNDWTTLLESNSDDVKNMKLHVERTIDESWQCKQKGTQYIPTFPDLILKTISKSDVFLYTSLLPKIPLKSSKLFSRRTVSYTNSEDNLIALGLEQFSQFVSQLGDKKISLNRKCEPQIKLVCSYIQEFMLPFKDAQKIYAHVKQSKSSKCGENPIKYYFRYGKAPSIVHFITSLNEMQILPPCKRQPNDLPAQWKEFIFNKMNKESTPLTLITTFLPSTIPTVYLQSPSNTQFISVISPQRPILPKPVSTNPIRLGKRKRQRGTSTLINQNPNLDNSCNKTRNYDPITKFVTILRKPSSLRKLMNLYAENTSETLKPNTLSKTAVQILDHTNNLSDLTKTNLQEYPGSMLPSMPHLTTPIKRPSPANSTPVPGIKYANVVDAVPLEYSAIKSATQQPKACDNNADAEFASNDTTIIVTTNNDKENQEMITKFESNTIETNIKKEANGSEKDNPEDIQNLLLASSTTRHTIRKELSGAEKKKNKIKKEFLANLSIATPEDPDVEMRKSEMFAFKYYDKMRETMDLEDYHKMIQLLNDHEGDAVELYNRISPILRPKYEELAEEFLLFLREKEACAVNQLIPWIQINNRSIFLRKLEMYFQDQPAQLKKIYKCLTELSQSMNVSMEKIRNTLLPLFKGNTILSELFLQNFMCEKPPASLLEGPYETIDINKEVRFDDDDDSAPPYEMITIPDVEDKFGGRTCICACHQIEDPEFKTKFRHCIRCGTKFVSGKVFIQTGKGLRPANFSFLTSPDTDHSIRLTGKPSTTICSGSNLKRRCDTSPSKQPSGLLLSPTKYNCDEESDYYDGDRKKKTIKKARNKFKKQTDKVDNDLKNSCKEDISPKNESRKSTINKKRCTIKKPLQKRRKSLEMDDDTNNKLECYKPGAMKGQKKRLLFATDEMIMSDFEDNSGLMVEEAGNGTSILTGEGRGEALLSPSFDRKASNSPEQNTAESESEFCEESSQDNCESDSNSSIASDNTQSQSDGNTDGGGDASWKRDEDKIILEAFQKENDKEDAFKSIARHLKNRSISQIRRRFDTLIKLLMDTVGKRNF